jgi:hypothetical protein
MTVVRIDDNGYLLAGSAIALAVKATTDDRPHVKKIAINLKNNSFSKGEVTTIQSPYTPAPNIKYQSSCSAHTHTHTHTHTLNTH